MGMLYASVMKDQGHQITLYDLEARIKKLQFDFGQDAYHYVTDIDQACRGAEVVIFSTPMEALDQVVALAARSIAPQSIVCGQASIKTPEVEAFERHLPSTQPIVLCHSMYGPTTNPKGQGLVVIGHRASDEQKQLILDLLAGLGSQILELPSYLDHDRMTADTQTLTHLGFQSMATAWRSAGSYPWEEPDFSGGIDNVKVLMALRILGGRAHVYGGLAIMNPFARSQVKQYVNSVTSLFNLMICEEHEALVKRIREASEWVHSGPSSSGLLLDDETLGDFSLSTSSKKGRANSHLSLLAMVDAWKNLGIHPYDNFVCHTPPFRLRLGIVEYLFKNPKMLEESLQVACFDKQNRSDDLEYVIAVREWATIIQHGDLNGYLQKFEQVQTYFKDRLEAAHQKSENLISLLKSH